MLAKGEECESIGSSFSHQMMRVCLHKKVSIWREAQKRNGERGLRPSGSNCVDSWTSSNVKFLNLFFELSWVEFENKLNITANKNVLTNTIIFSTFSGE